MARGKIRKEVLENLKEPKTPTQLSHIINTQRSTVSRSILALESKELVRCLTPNEKMGRFYEITEKGKEVLDSLGSNKNAK